jgi:hypothetical protein
VRLLTFPGSYEDDRGVEPLEWRVVPTWPAGWAPGFAVSTVIRGVRVRGGDFDVLLPRRREAAEGRLRWDRVGLIECLLTGDLPVSVENGDVLRPAVVRFQLDLHQATRVRPGPGTLRLSCVLDGVESVAVDDWFEDGLRALEADLPAGVRLAACITCRHADYPPTGHGLSGMRCHRDATEPYPPGVRVPVTEEVLETHLCTDFRRRQPSPDATSPAPSRASATSLDVARRYFLR